MRQSLLERTLSLFASGVLATFHGGRPWDVDHRALVAQEIVVEQAQVRWVDWACTSSRGPQSRHMKLSGIVGGALLRGVPESVWTVLLAGSLVHVGKAERGNGLRHSRLAQHD